MDDAERAWWLQRIWSAEHGGAWQRADRLRRDYLQRCVDARQLESGQGRLFDPEDTEPDHRDQVPP